MLTEYEKHTVLLFCYCYTMDICKPCISYFEYSGYLNGQLHYLSKGLNIRPEEIRWLVTYLIHKFPAFLHHFLVYHRRLGRLVIGLKCVLHQADETCAPPRISCHASVAGRGRAPRRSMNDNPGHVFTDNCRDYYLYSSLIKRVITTQTLLDE